MSVILGMKKYAKNGNDKENHYALVRGNDEESIIAAVSMSATSIEGNEDLYKTSIEYMNERGGEFESLGIRNKYNLANNNIIDAVSPIGAIRYQENYRLGLNNNDSIEEYLKENPKDTVVMVDYTGWSNDKKMTFHFGEETPLGKYNKSIILSDVDDSERVDFEKIYKDSLTLPLNKITPDEKSSAEIINTLKFFNKDFKLELSEDLISKTHYALQNINSEKYSLLKAYSLAESFYDNELLANEFALNFLNNSIDTKILDKYSVLDRIESSLDNPKDTKESIYLLPDGFIVKTPIRSGSADLDKLKADYGITKLGELKDKAEFIAEIQNGQIIKTSDKYNEAIRLEFLDKIDFGNHNPLSISQERAKELVKAQSMGENPTMTKEERKYLSLAMDGLLVQNTINGTLHSIAKGDISGEERFKVEIEHSDVPIRYMTLNEIINTPAPLGKIDINGYELYKESEISYLYSPGGKELALYRDEEEDLFKLQKEVAKANQIQIYSIDQNGGGSAIKNLAKWEELESNLNKYQTYTSRLNTDDIHSTGNDLDIAQQNALIIGDVSHKIQALAKELGISHAIDNSSIESLNKSLDWRGPLEDQIEMAKKEVTAKHINVSTNLGDFKINHTNPKPSNYTFAEQKQSFPDDFKNTNKDSLMRLESFAQKLTAKVVEKYPREEYNDYWENDLKALASSIDGTLTPTWNEIINPEIKTQYDEGYYIQHNDKTYEHLNSLDNQIDDGIRVNKTIEFEKSLELEKGARVDLQNHKNLTKDNPYKNLLTSSQIHNISERLSKDVLAIQTLKGILTFKKEDGMMNLYDTAESTYHQKDDCGFTTANLGEKPHLGSTYASSDAITNVLKDYDVPHNVLDEWGNLNFGTMEVYDKLSAEQFANDFKVSESEKPYFDDAKSKITSGYSTAEEIWGTQRPEGLRNIQNPSQPTDEELVASLKAYNEKTEAQSSSKKVSTTLSQS